MPSAVSLFAMSSTTASKVYHLVVGVYYYWVAKTMASEVVPPILRDFPPSRDGIAILLVQLITFWSLIFQSAYFASALCEDILEVTSRESARKKLKHFNDTFFVYFVWPSSFVLVVDFWMLYACDVRLIEPYRILFDHISWEMNHVIHTYVAAVVVVEAFLTHRPHSKDVASAVRTMAVNVAVYFGTVIVTQPFGEIWSYPFLRDMTCWQWLLYILFNLALTLASHFAGAVLNAIVWGRSIITISDFIGAEDELKKML